MTEQDWTPPHGIERPEVDGLEELLDESLAAVHAHNTGRPIRDLATGVVYIGPGALQRYLADVSKRRHPSG